MVTMLLLEEHAQRSLSKSDTEFVLFLNPITGSLNTLTMVDSSLKYLRSPEGPL